MYSLRSASIADLAELLPRMRALNDREEIEISDEKLVSALGTLLGSPSLGAVWLVTRGDDLIGYAVVTFGYDLEFGGRDAYLTELWIDAAHRKQGAGTAVLGLLEPELRAHDVHALHLHVRPDNPALRLYERTGFTMSPRRVMTRRIGRPPG